VLAPLGGDMADRFDRKRIVIACNILRALIMFALTFFVLIEAHPALLVGCVLLSAITATPQRAASAAMVPSIVERDDLAVANAADAVVHQTAWLLGPAVGAALTSLTGPAVAMFVNALTFVVTAYCIARVRLRPAAATDESESETIDGTPDAPKGFVGRTLEGVSAIRTSRALRSVTLLLAGSLFVFGAEEVLTVLFAVDRLNLGDAGAGYLMTAVGVGGLLAAPLAGRFAPSAANVGRIMLATGAMLSLPLCVLAITRRPVIALAVMLVEGAGTIVFETVMVTVTQLETNETLLGRVAGLHEFVAGAAQLLGAAAAPLLVSGVGLSSAAITVGVIVVVCTVAGAASFLGTRGERLRASVDGG
jgi:predicted MFS family arabinose efflux permease